MKVVQITSQEAGQRLDKYLGKYLHQAPKSFLYKMMRKKNIILNGKKAEGREKIKVGDEVKFFLSDETIAKFHGAANAGDSRNAAGWQDKAGNKAHAEPGLSIVFEDENILVVNKPAGLLSQKADKADVSLVEYIVDYLMTKEQQRESVFRPGICNRLDRNTTGLIAAGKNVESLQYLNRMFRERELKKYYLCLVRGKVTSSADINGYLRKDEFHNRVSIVEKQVEGAVRIITAYEPLKDVFWKGQEYTLLQVHLVTGKAHQIRAHLQSIGHPIVGDVKYGEKSLYQQFRKEFGVQYQLLHAWKLCLGNPEYLPEKYRGAIFRAPLPQVFREVLAGVGIDGAEF